MGINSPYRVLFFIFLMALPGIGRSQEHPTNRWVVKLGPEIDQLVTGFNGKVGVFVQSVGSATQYLKNAQQQWYLASAIKLGVLIEVFQQIESGVLAQQAQLILNRDDYVDGEGSTNWLGIGTSVPITQLMESMMIDSDNTATDMLIKRIGLKKINLTLTSYVNKGFGPITRLIDVRKHVYGAFHPRAADLSNLDFISIRKIKGEAQKIRKVSQLIHVPRSKLRAKNYRQAYQEYYRSGVNSASLMAYGELLAKIARGKVVNTKVSRQIIELMLRCKTGKRRVSANFPNNIRFAHKTGTQYRRLCDMGIATKKQMAPRGEQHVVMAVCAADFSALAPAEKLLADIGQAIINSGVFR